MATARVVIVGAGPAGVRCAETLLAAETAHFGHGHALHAGLHQGLAHVFQLVRLDDGDDQLHLWCLHGVVRCGICAIAWAWASA